MMNVSKFLRGCRIMKDPNGKMVAQSILNMRIVLLTTDDEFSHDKFANPMDIVVSNRRYGHMAVSNQSSKPTILPAQIAVITKQQAQDHGMVKAAYVGPKKTADFTDAGCVQGSQGGTISANKSEQTVRFLPLGTREMVFAKVGNRDNLGNIYEAIEKVGQQTGANSGRYLVEYFRKLDDRLATFISHFEKGPKCIGAIVLVDGEIIAVDKFPSFTYTEQIWDALIRDCYGSVAIVQERAGSKPDAGIRKHVKGRGSAAERLRRALDARRNEEETLVSERLAELMEIEFNSKSDPESSGDGYDSRIIECGGYVGQIISEGGFNHLVSIVKKDRFTPETFRKASEMRKKASRQEDFKL